MRTKNRRDSNYILQREDLFILEIDKEFKKIYKIIYDFFAYTRKSDVSGFIDMVLSGTFAYLSERSMKYSQETFIFALARAYSDLAVTAPNLEQQNKYALEYSETRREYFKKMKQYTQERIMYSIRQALAENISYQQYLNNVGLVVLNKNRARLIAETEIGNAYVQGTKSAVRIISTETGQSIKKKWSTVGDGRVTQGCKHNQAQGWEDIDYEYENIDGAGIQNDPPRFPGCRCALIYKTEEE